MSSADDRQFLVQLEQRVQRLEDELAVLRLLTSYGPLVDAGDAEGAAELWSEEGEYDVEGWHMRGRTEIRDMVRSERHQTLITGGSTHFFGPANITIDGDEATAVCESILVRHTDGEFSIYRAGAHRIQLRRVSDSWQIVRRTTRPLNGSAEARELLALRDN
ncbi:nuclear transport factor 2 family protein [Nocardia salmonicida]|uniref:nuclear transport factor 2 family protein n=1 Tax=Nocardia salmonicida TaxID=53431 RepID=UPI0037BBC95E